MKLGLKNIERISKALGDPYRLKIMESVQKEKDFLPCTTIVDMICLNQSTISHHVKQLIDADLLFAEKDGRNVKYAVNREVFDEYIDYLSQFGTKELANTIKEH
jgi:ArsR family transcriptional regulator